MYFSLRYLIQKHNLVCFFAIPKEGQTRITKTSQIFVALTLFFFQFVTSFTFILNQNAFLSLFCGLFTLVSLVWTVFVVIYVYHSEDGRGMMVGRKEDEELLTGGEFKHPLLAVGVEELAVSS